MKYFKSLALVVLMFFLSCGDKTYKSSYEEPPVSNSFSTSKIESAIIAKHNKDIIVLSNKNFTWSPKSIYVYKDERFKGFPVKETFEKAIYEKLTQSGFTYTKIQDANLLVGYTLALESALSDRDINILYGIDPGLESDPSNPNKYEKGTVIINILEARTNRFVWRGGLQAFANFDLPNEVREERIKIAVDTLLAKFISLYGNN